MIGALWTGISGLSSQQKALDNESHNIANVNTVGYKASRISFADQMYQDRIGKGSKILDAEKLYVQGNLKVTGVSYDMALSGNGFFAVANKSSTGTSETFYTRAGNFRMGDNGTLQDAAGNEVQGWTMSPVTEDDITSTNSNINVFTSAYNQLLSSKIVTHSNFVETFTAKSTDYTQTVKADADAVFSGYGLKTAASKTQDIEALVKNYNNALSQYQDYPDGPSQSAISQISQINFKGSDFSKEGDQIYVYIDGNKISQNYVSVPARTADDGTTALSEVEASQIATYKALADKISKITGFVAYNVSDSNTVGTSDLFESSDSFNKSTKDLDVLKGMIQIEGVVPGQEFKITEVAEISGTTTSFGVYNETSSAVPATMGYGLGGLESARDALARAISGNQRDVYSIEELNLNGKDDYSLNITVYDKTLDQNITFGPITIENPSSIDDVVSDIASGTNTALVTTFNKYFTVKNVNGALVIETNNTNYDVEFSTELTATEQVYTPTSGTTVTFDGVNSILANSQTSFQISLTGTSGASTASMPTFTINSPRDLETIKSLVQENLDKLSLNYDVSINDGSLEITAGTGAPSHISASITKVLGGLEKNPAYSGRKGAGAEFLEIVTTLDQTASLDSLQLRLDTLNISDSAFGEFSVDSSGLITMKQDGAEFAVGQVAIALFNNERGLDPRGDNLLAKTTQSGEPTYNVNNDRTAKIEAQTLELSTADLSESLVNLMVFQRAFEANAKSITTSDTLLSTLINLKR